MAKAFTFEQFVQRTGANIATLNQEQVEYYIETFTDMLDNALGYIFTTTAVEESDLINYGTENQYGSTFVSIGAWQESGLTIKRVNYDEFHTASLTQTALTLGSDYRLYYSPNGTKIPGQTQAITAIILFHALKRREGLRVYGTHGYSNGYPTDAQNLILAMVNKVIKYASTLNRTNSPVLPLSEKDLSSSITLQQVNIDDLETIYYNYLNSDEGQRIIRKYQLLTQETISYD